MKRRYKLAAVPVVLVLLLGLYAVRRPILVQLGDWLDVGETPVHSEFVLALPGDEDTRPFVAAALAKTGFAERALILPSQASPDEEDGLVPPTSEITRRVYEARGVPEDRLVYLTGTSTSTFHDASIVRDHMREHAPDARLLVVTNHYHSRRARWIFRRVFGNDMARVTFVSAPIDGVTAENWWTRSEGLFNYTSEYIKLTAYLFVYGGVVVWAVVGLAVLLGAVILVRWWRKRRSRIVECRAIGAS